jgi:hypothetical protein
MKFIVFAIMVSALLLVGASTTTAQEKRKAERVSGDIGLLDLEKNYMILVTKEGKLIPLEFDKKTKAILLKEEKAKMSDIGLGSSASVEYTEKGEKKNLTAIEFLPAKGGE